MATINSADNALVKLQMHLEQSRAKNIILSWATDLNYVRSENKMLEHLLDDAYYQNMSHRS